MFIIWGIIAQDRLANEFYSPVEGTALQIQFLPLMSTNFLTILCIGAKAW